MRPKNRGHFGAKVADQRYWAPTVGSLLKVNKKASYGSHATNSGRQRLRLHGRHLGQRSYHERGSDSRQNTPVNHRRRPAIAKRELKSDCSGFPGALQHKGEVDR